MIGFYTPKNKWFLSATLLLGCFVFVEGALALPLCSAGEVFELSSVSIGVVAGSVVSGARHSVLPAPAAQKPLFLARKRKRKSLRSELKKACRRYLKKTKRGKRVWPNRKDRDKDGVQNYLERMVTTNKRRADSDYDGLKDGYELCVSLTDPTNPDSDGDGIPDGEDPDTISDPSSNQCQQNGDTNAFGIPAGLTGNIGRGDTKYGQVCSSCHPGIEKGAGLEYAALKSATSGSPMFLQIPKQDLADLAAFLNRAKCTSPDQPSGDQPNPTPVPTPVPPGGGNGTPGLCTPSGDTTSFGIPSGYTGNINMGATRYAQTCADCHPGIRKGSGLNFGALSAAVSGAPMFLSLATQELADLTAYLNEQNCDPTNPSPTPSPTPTDPLARGYYVYLTTCSSCHSRPREFKELTRSKLDHAIDDEDEMNGITLTEQEYSDLLAYFHSPN